MAPRNDNPGRVTRSMAAANAMSDLVKAAKPTRVEKSSIEEASYDRQEGYPTH
jgi:hypothetical protein